MQVRPYPEAITVSLIYLENTNGEVVSKIEGQVGDELVLKLVTLPKWGSIRQLKWTLVTHTLEQNLIRIVTTPLSAKAQIKLLRSGETTLKIMRKSGSNRAAMVYTAEVVVTDNSLNEGETSQSSKGPEPPRTKKATKSEPSSENEVSEKKSLNLELYDILLISKKAAEKFEHENVTEVIDFITENHQLKEVFISLQNDRQNDYLEALSTHLTKKGLDIDNFERDEVNRYVRQAMNHALQYLMNSYDHPKVQSIKESTIDGGEIKKTHSWEDLKDKF